MNLTTPAPPGQPPPSKTQLQSDFESLLDKTARLKDFAVKNGYDVDPKTLKDLNELVHKVTGGKITSVPSAADRTNLDCILADLTTVTFPITIESLDKSEESGSYRRFRRSLFYVSACALAGAIVGFILSVKPPSWVQIPLANSILALSLGLLGAVVYSFFAVLRVIPAQAFDPDDEYANYARLVLGLLMGWIFYFTFARAAFEKLAGPNVDPKDMLMFLLPFVAGYSTRFVIGVLERSIVALETGLGINDRRDTTTRATRRKRP